MNTIPTNAEITALARQSLKDKWGKSTLLFFFLAILPLLLKGVAKILPPISVFTLAVMCLQVLANFATTAISFIWVLTLVKESKWEIPDFDKFTFKFGSIVGTSLLINLFVFLWSLLLIIPGIIATLNYSLAIFIVADDPAVPVAEALKISKKMMYGFRWKFICLNFRFIGWLLLCLCTCGIGFFFLAPYIAAANTHFYRLVREKYEAENGQICYENYNGMSVANTVLISILVILLNIVPVIAAVLLNTACSKA